MPALFCLVRRLCLGGEQFVHRGAQGFGQVEGQGQGGVVFVVLNGVDGLAETPQALASSSWDRPRAFRRARIWLSTGSPPQLVPVPGQRPGEEVGGHHQGDQGVEELPPLAQQEHQGAQKQVPCPSP